MTAKHEASEKCISAENVKFVVEALNEHIMNQTRRGKYIVDIRSTVTARDAIKEVYDRANHKHDDICFIAQSH
jgi:hypothetical protein